MLRRLTPVFPFSLIALLAVPMAAQQFSVRVQLPDQSIDAVDGGTVTMPAAGIGQTITASVVVTNRGSAPATVNFLQPSGSNDFVLSNVPELPVGVASRGTFAFSISYTA